MRRVVIPRALEIGGKIWTVCRESELSSSLKKRLGRELPSVENAKGLCIHVRRLILLADALEGPILQETFLHEVMHACLSRNDALSEEAEETFIEALDAPLSEVLGELEWEDL